MKNQLLILLLIASFSQSHQQQLLQPLDDPLAFCRAKVQECTDRMVQENSTAFTNACFAFPHSGSFSFCEKMPSGFEKSRTQRRQQLDMECMKSALRNNNQHPAGHHCSYVINTNDNEYIMAARSVFGKPGEQMLGVVSKSFLHSESSDNIDYDFQSICNRKKMDCVEQCDIYDPDSEPIFSCEVRHNFLLPLMADNDMEPVDSACVCFSNKNNNLLNKNNHIHLKLEERSEYQLIRGTLGNNYLEYLHIIHLIFFSFLLFSVLTIVRGRNVGTSSKEAVSKF